MSLNPFDFFGKDANTQLADAMSRLSKMGLGVFPEKMKDKKSIEQDILQALKAGADPNKKIDVVVMGNGTFHGKTGVVSYDPLNLAMGLINGPAVMALIDHGAELVHVTQQNTQPSFNHWAHLCALHGGDSLEEDGDLREMLFALTSGKTFDVFQQRHADWADWAMERLGVRTMIDTGKWMRLLIGAGADVGRMKGVIEKNDTGECLRTVWAEYCAQQNKVEINMAIGLVNAPQYTSKARKF